jgi:hypothetical protein
MSQAIKHQDYLTLLSKSIHNKKRRNTLIDIATKQEIGALQEAIFNLIQGSIPLTQSQLNKLKRQKTAIRKILSNSSLVAKKKILKTQGGGFLGILPIALGALTSILGLK